LVRPLGQKGGFRVHNQNSLCAAAIGAAAAQAAGLRFILNVVIDQDKQIVAAFAGAPEAAHQSGCRFAAKAARVQAAPAEIVVTYNGGYPLDQNIYQSVKPG
jgi:lactate racemase